MLAAEKNEPRNTQNTRKGFSISIESRLQIYFPSVCSVYSVVPLYPLLFSELISLPCSRLRALRDGFVSANDGSWFIHFPVVYERNIPFLLIQFLTWCVWGDRSVTLGMGFPSIPISTIRWACLSMCTKWSKRVSVVGLRCEARRVGPMSSLPYCIVKLPIVSN